MCSCSARSWIVTECCFGDARTFRRVGQLVAGRHNTAPVLVVVCALSMLPCVDHVGGSSLAPGASSVCFMCDSVRNSCALSPAGLPCFQAIL